VFTGVKGEYESRKVTSNVDGSDKAPAVPIISGRYCAYVKTFFAVNWWFKIF
jgi:hypothetical protein